MTIHNPAAYQFAEVPNPPVAYCDGKICFDSPKLAFEVANGRRSRGKRKHMRCKKCGFFHVAGPKR